jgi:hypothetical protein
MRTVTFQDIQTSNLLRTGERSGSAETSYEWRH